MGGGWRGGEGEQVIYSHVAIGDSKDYLLTSQQFQSIILAAFRSLPS